MLRGLIMFNWIRKLKNHNVFDLDLKNTSTTPVISGNKSYFSDITIGIPVQETLHQYDVEKLLIDKHLTKKQIYQASFVGQYSDIIINFNKKNYTVGVNCLTEYGYLGNSSYYYLHVIEIKSGSNNITGYLRELQGLEKCKFLLEKLPEVEMSLNNISENLNKKQIDVDCKQKCLTELSEKIKGND